MLTIYFSGTGNSKYIAEVFSKKMGAACHSIEEDLDFAALFDAHDTVAICYPIYGSRVPLIMREFAAKHSDAFAGKKLIVFATQLIFSGDGARVFMDLLPEGHAEVIYAAHLFMPNNISNVFFLRKPREASLYKRAKKADRKIDAICRHINEGKIKRRGFSWFAKWMGKVQGVPWQGKSRSVAAVERTMEYRAMRKVKIGTACNLCGVCIACCPMENFENARGTVVAKDNCTVCYRCVNRCPHKAISVWFAAKPKWQYKGIPGKGDENNG